jgi:hypothetical protein
LYNLTNADFPKSVDFPIALWYSIDTKLREEKTMTVNTEENKCWNCEECIHFILEDIDDVACCNCCEEGSFFEKNPFAVLEEDWWCNE